MHFKLIYVIILAYGAYCKNEIVFNFEDDDNRKIVTVSGNSSNNIIVHNIPFAAVGVQFELHSHIENVTLSSSKEACFHCSVTGNDIGMVYKLHSSESDAHMWLLNSIEKNISCLIIISVLDSEGVIPGGCNMEFKTEIAPYLKLKNELGNLYLEFQHASISSFRDIPDIACSVSLSYITYDVYFLHMEENNFREDEYFNKIIMMSNLSLIKEKSNQVTSYSVHPDTRLSFLMYPNIGVVYNIIAKYTINGAIKEAHYVSASTYGCGASEFTEYGCNFSYILEEKCFLFLLSIYGFITCYFGHLFYGSTLFFFVFLTSYFITLILMGKFSDFPRSKILLLTGLVGIMSGLVCLVLWIRFHNFILSLLLIGFVFGFLLTAVVLYSPIGNLKVFLNEKNYWLFLATGSLLTTVIFLGFPTVLSILGSSVVGSYIMLLFYDDFIGTRLSYIILNVVKKGISKRADFITNEYPFEARDAIIFAAWFVVASSAILVQSRELLGINFILNFKKICCKCRHRNYINLDSQNALENDSRQRLLNDDQSFYNTFPKR